MNAFLTGSRAYGTPRTDSDTDIVMLMSEEDLQGLYQIHGPGDDVDEDPSFSTNNGKPTNYSFKIGRANLICMTDPEDFQAWKSATEVLIRNKPVTRDLAIQTIDLFLKLADSKKNEQRRSEEDGFEARLAAIVPSTTTEAAELSAFLASNGLI